MPSVKTTKAEFIEIYSRQVDTVYRVCYSFMKNKADTEDLVQETFLKLLSTKKEFENERHERAWLIVTASNACKDLLKRPWRREDVLQEYEAALVVGEKTTGKGHFQSTFQLKDGSAVALSIGKYYTPKGISLEGVGITPDISAPVDDSIYADILYGQLSPQEDPQIQAALAALK